MKPKKPPSNYRYSRHMTGTCWLVFDKRTNKLFTSTTSRREARELIDQQDALERKEREAVAIEVEWKP